MPIDSSYSVRSLDETYGVAKDFASRLSWPACVYMQGDLGSGKTTFCQGIIASLGNSSPVTSPTYTLIQEYPVASGTIYHMDLYRLNDPSELEYLALADLWTPQSIFLIEWPEKGGGYLPDPSHTVTLSVQRDGEADTRTIQIES